ncbi:hypothetical protein D0Z07_1215 [Hyphodiscus hymeniophilus]|uniref:HhH-GPD domain-containing protein n=1 Tax=Hyphodiscus hymeniophilus TaxID=353542 RepID=A0A9P6VQX8_9HELO|nr:hypothetical protein D0Z07_1215 [Hyphodiscus hymeniophilus]
MPPKQPHQRNTRAVATHASKDALKKENEANEDTETSNEAQAKSGGKRKGPPSVENQEPPTKSTKTSSSEIDIIKFLLSPGALSLCQGRKTDVSQFDAKSGKDYFSPDLTPFEHLLCAAILSRPISHVLGQRTIRTVLNDPWNWNTAQPIIDAGKENQEGKTERLKAMEEARTQHRQKTAAELGALAVAVIDEKWDEREDGSLDGLLEASEGKEREVRRLLKKIKGIGDTAVDIFVRRVQGCKGWETLGWFVDSKTEEALVKVGLPGDAEDVKKLVEESGSENVRRDFARVLERSLGVALEGRETEIPPQ